MAYAMCGICRSVLGGTCQAIFVRPTFVCLVEVVAAIEACPSLFGGGSHNPQSFICRQVSRSHACLHQLGVLASPELDMECMSFVGQVSPVKPFIATYLSLFDGGGGGNQAGYNIATCLSLFGGGGGGNHICIPTCTLAQ